VESPTETERTITDQEREQGAADGILKRVVADMAREWDRYVAAGLNDASLDDRGEPLPEEPEDITVMRAVVKYWDDLQADHARYDRPDHPVARDLARTEAVHARHGASDLALAYAEEDARRYRTAIRAELWRVSRRIRDMKIPLPLLREFVEDPAGDQGKRGGVRSALTEWIMDPASIEKKHRAQTLVDQYVARRRRPWGLSRLRRNSDAFRSGPRVEDLLAQDDEARRQARRDRPRPSGKAEERAQRIMKRLENR